MENDDVIIFKNPERERDRLVVLALAPFYIPAALLRAKKTDTESRLILPWLVLLTNFTYLVAVDWLSRRLPGKGVGEKAMAVWAVLFAICLIWLVPLMQRREDDRIQKQNEL